MMKNFLLPMLLASALIVSCSKDKIVVLPTEETGTLVLWPMVNSDAVEVVTRANTPLEDFTGYAFTLNGEELEWPDEGKIADLEPGDYTAGLSNMPDDFEPAFDDPRYGGTNSTMVVAKEETPLLIVLKQANTGIRFIYDPSLEDAGLEALTATITQGDDALTYEGAVRTSTGYFSPGEAILTLTNNGQPIAIVQDESKIYELEAQELWTITLRATVINTGGLAVIAEIDTTVIEREDEINIDIDGSGEKELNPDIFTKITDPNFMEVCRPFDINGDGFLSREEAELVTDMDTKHYFNSSKQRINSLDGIEYFINLETLRIAYNNISSVNLSSLTKLKRLLCSNNQLTSLNLDNNTLLEALNCSYNMLPALDISECENLYILHCHKNRIPSLNITNMVTEPKYPTSYTVYCGHQTTDGSEKLQTTLTMREDQYPYWDSQLRRSYDDFERFWYNDQVTIEVI